MSDLMAKLAAPFNASDLLEKRRAAMAYARSQLKPLPAIIRWCRKVALPGDPDACWPWVGGVNPKGYGRFSVDGRLMYAHRFGYTTFVGDIPDGMQIDHLCRNPNCVNPEHLEPVSQHENILRGEAVSAVHAKKTHCPRGHAYAGDNLIVRKRGVRDHRVCRTCQNLLRRTGNG